MPEYKQADISVMKQLSTLEVRVIMPKKISVTKYIYSSPKITGDFDGYKIAVISDLHANEIGECNSILINKLKDINPDSIMIAGDMVCDNAKDMHVTYELLSTLSKSYEIYYGCGNHEMKLALNPITKKIYHKYRRAVRSMGIHYLNNKTCTIKRRNGTINVTGLNISRRYYKKIKKIYMPDDYIDRLVNPAGICGAGDSTLSILIAHNPIYFKQYAAWGADIVLSGHIHGGIMVLPFVGGVISPTLELFPHYDFGEFSMPGKIDGHTSKMYLSRGLGSHTIPIRINNPPEIMVLELYK